MNTARAEESSDEKERVNARNILSIHLQSPPPTLTVLEKGRKKHVLFPCFDPQKILF
jgi:hypothetical protein